MSSVTGAATTVFVPMDNDALIQKTKPLVSRAEFEEFSLVLGVEYSAVTEIIAKKAEQTA